MLKSFFSVLREHMQNKIKQQISMFIKLNNLIMKQGKECTYISSSLISEASETQLIERLRGKYKSETPVTQWPLKSIY